MSTTERERPHRMRTLCVHGGYRPSPEDAGLSPAIQRSSTFLQHAGTHAATDAGRWEEVLVYSRYGNPTVAACEARLAALEGAPRALLFGSGMAAMHAGVLALARPGSAIAAARQLYGGTLDLLRNELVPLGFRLLEFDVAHENALHGMESEDVSLVLCESLSNPTLIAADLPRLAADARSLGASLLVDATFASPMLQRPLELGADLVMHSATKYLGGHSDLIAGVLAGAPEAMRRCWALRRRCGGVLDPGAAFLLDRGVRTLALRVSAQCEGALHLARVLSRHSAVSRVHYPGLETHPTHERARRLLSAAGGVLAFELTAGDEALRGFVARLRLALDAPSLGGVETLVSLPVHMSHAGLAPEARLAAGIGAGLVRVAVGIEDPEDLAQDFVQALGGT